MGWRRAGEPGTTPKWLGLGLVLVAAVLTHHAAVAGAVGVAPQAAGFAGVVTELGPTLPAPIRGSLVTLSAVDSEFGRTTLTDDAGHFEFRNVPPGLYGLSAAKPGYESVQYGAASPRRHGTSISLKAGEELTLSLTLPKACVIAGTVRDGDGRPIYLAAVSVLQYRSNNGVRVLAPLAGDFSAPRLTNDRGEYRFYGLPSGKYVIAAAPEVGTGMSGPMRQMSAVELAILEAQAVGNNPTLLPSPALATSRRTLSLPTVYYPSAVDVRFAVEVPLLSGDEKADIDLVLEPEPAVTIAGMIIGPNGEPVSSAQVSIMPAHPVLPASVVGVETSINGSSAIRVEGGVFAIPGVTSGEYDIIARSPATGNGAVLWGTARAFAQNADITDLKIILQPGAAITGQITFAGQSTHPPASDLLIELQPVGSQSARPFSTTPNGDGSFHITGIFPSVYIVTASVRGRQGPWVLLKAAVKARDVHDDPLDLTAGETLADVAITFTDYPAELSGVLRTPIGGPASDYLVIVCPANPALWRPGSSRIRASRPGSDGRFSFDGLPAGEYRLGAIIGLDDDEGFDASILTELVSASVPVSLRDGERRVQSLTIGLLTQVVW